MNVFETRDHELVALAYVSAQQSRQDEWTAFDIALDTFRRRHPEASAEFANHFVADVLRTLPEPSPEWISIRDAAE